MQEPSSQPNSPRKSVWLHLWQAFGRTQAVAYPEFGCYSGTMWSCALGSLVLRNLNVVDIKQCICKTSSTAFVIKP